MKKKQTNDDYFARQTILRYQKNITFLFGGETVSFPLDPCWFSPGSRYRPTISASWRKKRRPYLRLLSSAVGGYTVNVLTFCGSYQSVKFANSLIALVHGRAHRTLRTPRTPRNDHWILRRTFLRFRSAKTDVTVRGGGTRAHRTSIDRECQPSNAVVKVSALLRFPDFLVLPDNNGLRGLCRENDAWFESVFEMEMSKKRL